MMAPPRRPIRERIAEKTDRQAGGCWIWTGSKFRDGYGAITVGRKGFRAHRVSYEAFNGPIADGMCVCHRCDTPLCVNPEHLFLGTPKDNTQDMLNKGRWRAPTVDTHPCYKIRPEQRSAIKRLRADGQTLTAIADQFGVTFQTISAICKEERHAA